MKALIWFCKEFKIGNVVHSKRIKKVDQENITVANIS
jgi:hypothetical protein